MFQGFAFSYVLLTPQEFQCLLILVPEHQMYQLESFSQTLDLEKSSDSAREPWNNYGHRILMASYSSAEVAF